MTLVTRPGLEHLSPYECLAHFVGARPNGIQLCGTKAAGYMCAGTYRKEKGGKAGGMLQGVVGKNKIQEVAGQVTSCV